MSKMTPIDELKEVAKTGILPDGDHINVPTQMWLEELVENELAQLNAIVGPLPANIGRLEQAKRFALMNFDKWNDVTGFVSPHTSYYYEICSCIEDAVEFGFGVAHGQNWKTIVRKIRKVV